MLVDAHMHIGAWSHPNFLGRRTTLEEASQVLEESGLGGAAIMPTDQCDNAGLLASANQGQAKGAALWFFAWLRSVDESGGAGDLAWAREHKSMVTGLKIHPSLSRQPITGEGFRPALELAEEYSLVVLVHCGRWQEIASYTFAVEAAQRHPRARFLLAHGGGDTPVLATAACNLVKESKVDNVWFEFSGVREYWVIERNVAELGAHRYLMGSDYNLAHPRMYLGALAAMNLPESDKQKILGDNARHLFGAPLSR